MPARREVRMEKVNRPSDDGRARPEGGGGAGWPAGRAGAGGGEGHKALRQRRAEASAAKQSGNHSDANEEKLPGEHRCDKDEWAGSENSV